MLYNKQLIELIRIDCNSKAVTDDKHFTSILKDLICEINRFNGSESSQESIEFNTSDKIKVFLKNNNSYLHADFEYDDLKKRANLLVYCASELLAYRKTIKGTPTLFDSNKMEVDDETNDDKSILNAYLIMACNALGIALPPENITAAKLLSKLHSEVKEKLAKCKPGHMGKSMIPKEGLSDKNWAQVSRLIALLQQDYTSRRGTLLKRLEVTVQSFKWSNRAQSQLDAIDSVYLPLREAMVRLEPVGVGHLLAARDNPLLYVEKTSGASRRRFTACDLNKVLIGQVPDRGGRAWELEPPPPEMPAFKKRENLPSGSRGGSFRGGGGGFQRGGPRNRGGHNRNEASFAPRNRGDSATSGSGLIFYGDPGEQRPFEGQFRYSGSGRRGRGNNRR